MPADPPEISVVVPVFNEEENVNELYRRCTSALSQITPSFEVICVDDGSSDGTFDKLSQLHYQDSRLKVITLSRNFGHQPALLAGLSEARGRYIAIIDGDLQDPPEMIEKLYKQLTQHKYDVAYAVRTKRKEGLPKKAAYWLFYRLLSFLSQSTIPLDSGDFCVMKRKVLQEMLHMPEQSLFLRGIRSWVGFRQIGVEIERDERQEGTPKYNLKKLVNLAFNGIFSFSNLPIKFLAWLGLFVMIFSSLYAVYLLVSKFVYNTVPEGFTTLILLLFLLSGVQLLAMGILGEYIARIYQESRQRPLFIIDKKLQ